ncbi:O-antigen translocase [Pseudomonas sp. D2-30]|uniref:O-antigen translocase n=1 Tax=unclassified Pseudomonas TaxID=196821 RepID=UPI003DA9E4BF
MTFLKTGLLNGLAVSVKMLTLLCINKVLAVYVGPSGYASLGQFQNAVQMITTFASGAINTGVTKYTAEYHEDVVLQRSVWRTAGTISICGALAVGLIVALFNKELALWFLKRSDYGSVFIWFSISLIFFVTNALLLAILNGRKDIFRFVTANVCGSIFALVITTIMAMRLGLYGALVALAIYQSLSCIVTFIIVFKAPWFHVGDIFGGVNKKIAVNLLKFTAMALTSAACVPLSHIFIRAHLGHTLGWESAGYWEAVWRLSAAYLMFITTTLSVYYLPRFSELKEADAIIYEIRRGYKVILPIAAFCGLAIYLLRDLVIQLLFTSQFYPMRDLFGWQMFGDTLKIGSWILAYLMLGKAMYKTFIITEVFFAASFVVLTFYFTNLYGLQGVAIAHAANYAAYWLIMGCCMSHRLKNAGHTEVID